MIRIALVDDHRILRDGLVALLEQDERFDVVGAAENAEAFLELCRVCTPDVAIIDISMPVIDGFDLAATLGGEWPELRMVFLTTRKDPASLAKAKRLGAAGFVLKDEAFDELAGVIEQVHAGRQCFSQRLKDHASNPFADLAPRESEVLHYIARGLLNKEIADQMDISLNTVRTHRARLMDKLNIHTGPELVRFAMEYGLDQ